MFIQKKIHIELLPLEKKILFYNNSKCKFFYH